MEEEKREQAKLSYEQLENVASQLQQRCAFLEKKIMSIDITSYRLNYLFKVIKHSEAFPIDFVSKCSKEIEDLLTLEETGGETKE